MFRNLYKAALYIKENFQDYLSLLISSSREPELKETLEGFQKLMQKTEDFYLVADKSDRLECFQALKKKDRAIKAQEIFEKHKQSLQDTLLLNNLYIKNLKSYITEKDLKEIFSKFGEIKSCKIVKNNLFDKISFFKTEIWINGFVSFFDEENAKKAKKEFNFSTEFAKTGLKLFVDYFEPKNQRQINLRMKQFDLYNFSLKTKIPFKNSEEIIKDNIRKRFFEKRIEELNAKNRISVLTGNDFDLIFAKFRHQFGVLIDGNENKVTENLNVVDKINIPIDKSFVATDNAHLNSYPYISKNNPAINSFNKCVIGGNKFDLGKENMSDNVIHNDVNNSKDVESSFKQSNPANNFMSYNNNYFRSIPNAFEIPNLTRAALNLNNPSAFNPLNINNQNLNYKQRN